MYLVRYLVQVQYVRMCTCTSTCTVPVRFMHETRQSLEFKLTCAYSLLNGISRGIIEIWSTNLTASRFPFRPLWKLGSSTMIWSPLIHTLTWLDNNVMSTCTYKDELGTVAVKVENDYGETWSDSKESNGFYLWFIRKLSKKQATIETSCKYKIILGSTNTNLAAMPWFGFRKLN